MYPSDRGYRTANSYIVANVTSISPEQRSVIPRVSEINIAWRAGDAASSIFINLRVSHVRPRREPNIGGGITRND